MNEFDIYDWELRRRFRGKVFLFEGCVVYTETLDREYLEFRGFYESDNTVTEWKTSITGMLMDFAAAGEL